MPNTTPNIPNFPPQGIQAQLDLLYLYNPDAANALIAQLQAGLIEMKELEEEVKKALQDMQGVMRYKGSVPTEADLPTEGNVIGDVWNIIDTDENVAWDGEKWDKYGSTIDTSTFLTKDEAKNAYINADASTYTLATLQDAFNYSPARLYKIFNEDKMPTKNTYTLFSLGWTYNDTNNQPTLLANDLQTSKFYFYHGTYENCSPATWQEFAFGGDLAQLIANIQAVIPSSASSSNQLVTEEDLMSHTELPAQQGNEGKFLTTNGTTPQWADVPSAGGIEWDKSIDYVSPGNYSTVYLTANLGDLANGTYSFYLRTRSRYSIRLEISKICKVELRVTSTKCEAVLSWVMEGDTTPFGEVPFLSPNTMTTPIARDENNNIIIGTQGPDGWGTDYGNAYKTNFSDIFSISEITNNSTGATTSAVELKYYTDQNADEYWVAISNTIGSVEIPATVAMPYIPSSISESTWDIPEGQVLSIQNVVANSVTDIKIVSNDKTTFARITKMADGVYFKTLFINELGLDVKVSAEDNNTICFVNLSGGCTTLLNSYGLSTNYPVPNVSPISTPASFVSVQDLTTSRTLVDNDIIPVGIGQIVQYIGATDSNYTNGYFYKATGTVVDTPASTVITPNTEGDSLSDPNGYLWGRWIDMETPNPTTMYVWIDSATKTLGLCTEPGGAGIMTFIEPEEYEPQGVVVDGNKGDWFTYTYTPAHTSVTDTKWEQVNVQPEGGSGTDNNGLEGDYCSRYGIVDETQSGLPRMGTGNQVIIPAGLVLDVPGVPGLTTNASQITHDLTATTNCELWLAQGNVLEVTDMFWQEDEPEDGTTGYAGWWNGTEMKFKSNDTGNVWRAANAVRIAKCIFTDGNLTRLCFTGCRLLNKQEWLPLSGGALTGPLVSSQNVSFFKKTPVLSLCAKNADGTNGSIATISMVPNADTLFLDSILSLNIITPTNVGSKAQKVSFAYIDKINNGANINVPATGGTMVVATPPTAEGTYVLKATVAADGTVTTTWVAE